MAEPPIRTIVRETDGPALLNSGVNGVLYAVVAVPVAALVAPWLGVVVPALVVLGPSLVFGVKNRGLLPAIAFVFPATHVLYLVSRYAPHILTPVGGAGPPPSPSYPLVALVSVILAVVGALFGYTVGEALPSAEDSQSPE